jgi:hypothetical protein
MSRRTKALRAMLREVDRRNRPAPSWHSDLVPIAFVRAMALTVRDLYPDKWAELRRSLAAEGVTLPDAP